MEQLTLKQTKSRMFQLERINTSRMFQLERCLFSFAS